MCLWLGKVVVHKNRLGGLFFVAWRLQQLQTTARYWMPKDEKLILPACYVQINCLLKSRRFECMITLKLSCVISL
jgi:hypothetical protein